MPRVLTRIAADAVPDTIREVAARLPRRTVDVRICCADGSDLSDIGLADLVGTTATGSGGLRVLCHRAAVADRDQRQRLSRLAARGVRVRLLRDPSPSMVTLGADVAVLRAARGGEPTAHSYLVRGREVVGLLRQLHTVLWEQATDLASLTTGVASIVLDPAQSQVLARLCSGAKDETAARQLNVSVRTYRRHVATIMRHLKVASRFEAGMRVAELGLLDIPGPDAPDAS